jgi:hypothetical protein
MCGGETSTADTRTCAGCVGKAERQEARSRVVRAIREWVLTYGEPPRAMDWDPSRARRADREDVAAVFEANEWPHLAVAVGAFGSLSKAIKAAGFEPRRAGRPKRVDPQVRASCVGRA